LIGSVGLLFQLLFPSFRTRDRLLPAYFFSLRALIHTSIHTYITTIECPPPTHYKIVFRRIAVEYLPMPGLLMYNAMLVLVSSPAAE